MTNHRKAGRRCGGHLLVGLAIVATVALGAAGAAERAVTPSAIEGPFYKSRSPERASLLEPGLRGVRLVLTGRVLTTDHKPIPRARLDFWQTDAEGRYDNAGYRLRGHQFTDEAGRYRLETVVPASYPGRTRHLHVKVQAPNQPVLTTQLYFPDELHNPTDPLFNPELVMQVQNTAEGPRASFDFILDTKR